MAVVDILRDRERGMVRYNQARRQYGLGAYTEFEQITDNADVSPLRATSSPRGRLGFNPSRYGDACGVMNSMHAIRR
jgi:hypothetical protein